MNKSEPRRKTSITLKDDLWYNFQQYALAKNRIARSTNIELEKAMTEYMKKHPVKKKGDQKK